MQGRGSFISRADWAKVRGDDTWGSEFNRRAVGRQGVI
jgi:hypothetical protein